MIEIGLNLAGVLKSFCLIILWIGMLWIMMRRR
jgi:hypothetical protein